MNSCKDCVCHLVCGIYAPDFNDILANGARCLAFKEETDFAEVVRCKDCKWWHTNCCAFRNDCVNGLPSEDDYCSHGQRKE